MLWRGNYINRLCVMVWGRWKVTVDTINPHGHGLYLRVSVGFLHRREDLWSVLFSFKHLAQEELLEPWLHRLQTCGGAGGKREWFRLVGGSSFLTLPLGGSVPGSTPFLHFVPIWAHREQPGICRGECRGALWKINAKNQSHARFWSPGTILPWKEGWV